MYYSINALLTHQKTPSFPTPQLGVRFGAALVDIEFITTESSESSLILPEDFIKELRHKDLEND